MVEHRAECQNNQLHFPGDNADDSKEHEEILRAIENPITP